MTAKSSRRSTIALVGCGAWGRYILRDLVTLGCSVPVVARSAASRERAIAGGAQKIVATIGELGSIDAAIVAVQTMRHAAVIDQLLPLGVPIFCEKPIASTLADAERLAIAAPDRLFVMDKWRYHPGVLELARIARTQELGLVRGLQTTRAQIGNPHPDNANVIWHLMPHDLSIAIEILGRVPEPLAAVADVVNGLVVGMHASFKDSVWMSTHVSARHLPYRREVRLYTERGVAWFGDSYDTAIQVIETDGQQHNTEPRQIPIGNAMPLLEELRTFVEHLNGGPPPRSSTQDALTSVRAIARLHELAGLVPRGGRE